MFGRSTDTEEFLPVDLLDDAHGDHLEQDVDFGGPRGTGSSRHRWTLVGAGVVVLAILAVAAGALGRDDDRTSAPPTTVATSAVPATTARGGFPTTSSPRRTTTTAANPLADLAPILPTDQPWSIYLSRDGQRSIRIDVQTGSVEPISDAQLAFVLSPTERYVVEWSSADGFYVQTGVLPAGPLPGTYWRVEWGDTGQQAVVLVEADGTAAGAEVGRLLIGPGEYLLGSTAAGEAVVNGPDGRAFVTGLDGRRQRLADGQVRAVDNGFYVETTCDVAGACRHLLHGATDLELPYGGAEFWATFSPDGAWAAIARQNNRGLMTTDLVHLATGAVIPIEDELVPSWTMTSLIAMSWTPDSRWAVGATNEQLVVVDVTTGEIRRFALPPRARGSTSVQAIL